MTWAPPRPVTPLPGFVRVEDRDGPDIGAELLLTCPACFLVFRLWPVRWSFVESGHVYVPAHDVRWFGRCVGSLVRLRFEEFG